MSTDNAPEPKRRDCEVSLKIGDKLYKQVAFDNPEQATYRKIVETWNRYRDISEVKEFVWVRMAGAYHDRYLILDDEDLRTALRSEPHIMIAAQGHSERPRNILLGTAVYIVLHFYLNWSLLWPLCRENFWSVCYTSRVHPDL